MIFNYMFESIVDLIHSHGFIIIKYCREYIVVPDS